MKNFYIFLLCTSIFNTGFSVIHEHKHQLDESTKQIKKNYIVVPTPFNFSCSDLKDEQVYEISDVGKLYVIRVLSKERDDAKQVDVQFSGYIIPFHYTKFYPTSLTLVEVEKNPSRYNSKPGIFSTFDNKFYQVLDNGLLFHLELKKEINIASLDLNLGVQFKDSTWKSIFSNYIGGEQANQATATTKCTTYLRDRKNSRFSLIQLDETNNINLDDFEAYSNNSTVNIYIQDDKKIHKETTV